MGEGEGSEVTEVRGIRKVLCLVGRESRWLKEDGGEPKVMIEGAGLATATVASMVRLWAREVIKKKKFG